LLLASTASASNDRVRCSSKKSGIVTNSATRQQFLTPHGME
jgi:hypothetical protein